PLPPLPPLPLSKQFLLASTPVVDPAALSPRFAVTTGKAVPTYLAVGAGPGEPGMVRVFDYASGVERFRLFPYGPAFSGGINVATGDVTGDGVPDIITGVRSGAGPHVKVFDGVTGAEIASFFAYAPGFLGGVSVAAGDVDGDGHADIITGAGPGADPHVMVFSGANLSVLRSFDAYAPAFTGGVHVAAGDLNGDGHADIVTAPIQGPTHVRAFDGLTGADLASFLAFSGFNGGTNVAVGDVDGDGRADIITGAGPGAAPHVKVFSGATLSELRSFLAFAPSFTGGVVVGALDANGDGRADLVVTPQQGPAHVRLLDGLTLAELDSFFAFHPALNGGAALS
ncbi:MAG TPA: VCBS repeat-containing protein, partial [Gemmataceae bacterium]|nr:VCBS repeat-containing protein [Gemmataceae bacterium]